VFEIDYGNIMVALIIRLKNHIWFARSCFILWFPKS